MRKKIMAVILSWVVFLTFLLSSFWTPLQVSAVSTDEITTTAVELIVKSEGSYGSVNPNDNGAISIGLLQWHANRGLYLMQSIASADPTTAESILGSTFYSEVVSASDWSSRTFSSSEAAAASSLLTTSTGVSVQDSQAYADVQGYIQVGQNIGLTDPCVLVYYADLYNRGSGIAARVVSAISSDNSSITLSQIHSAAMADSSNSSGYYTERLTTLYNTLCSLGWSQTDTAVQSDEEESSADFAADTSASTEAVSTESVDDSVDVLDTTETTTDTEAVFTVTETPSDFTESYAGEYIVNASSLNIRNAPDMSAEKIGSIGNEETVTIISGDGSWAKVNYGDITGYCSMDYLYLAEETELAVETTTEAAEATTEAVTTEETTTETTTTTTTMIATEATTTVTESETTTTEWTAATTETVTETTTTTTTTTEWVAATSTEVEGVSDPEYATVYGDVNCDGIVDTADAVLLQRYLYGYLELNDRQLANADCQRDDVLNVTDVNVIMQYLIQKLTAVPVV